MKQFINGYVMLFLFVLVACDEHLDTEGVSKITYYPIITLQGDQWMQVTQGGSWTDPGVKAKEGDNEIPVATGGDVVDPNTPGVYTITYTAVNKDGFSITDYRYVGVIDPLVVDVNIEGRYKRNAGAQGISTVTRVNGNLYQTNNVGGVAVPGPATTVMFYHYAPGALAVPLQFVGGSPFFCSDATIEEGVKYSWIVMNGGYLNNLRTFVKQ